MDSALAIFLILTGVGLALIGICIAIIRYRRSRHKGRVLASSPVIVTTTTTTTPGNYPVTVQGAPYPTAHGMPMPQPQPMMPNPPYPAHPGAMPQPYGPPQGYSNPPYPSNDIHRMNPPSYDQVISSEATQKQAPYNPNYMAN